MSSKDVEFMKVMYTNCSCQTLRSNILHNKYHLLIVDTEPKIQSLREFYELITKYRVQKHNIKYTKNVDTK